MNDSRIDSTDYDLAKQDKMQARLEAREAAREERKLQYMEHLELNADDRAVEFYDRVGSRLDEILEIAIGMRETDDVNPMHEVLLAEIGLTFVSIVNDIFEEAFDETDEKP